MRKDIPLMAYFEHGVLALAAQEGALQSSARRIEERYGLPREYLGSGLLWQPRVLSLLYTLILFPKELWSLGQDDPIFRAIEQRWSLDGIEVITDDELYGNTVYGFVHRLRNALAHARITFRGDDIECWDRWREMEAYRVRVPRAEAEKFVGVVGVEMANRRNRADP